MYFFGLCVYMWYKVKFTYPLNIKSNIYVSFVVTSIMSFGVRLIRINVIAHLIHQKNPLSISHGHEIYRMFLIALLYFFFCVYLKIQDFYQLIAAERLSICHILCSFKCHSLSNRIFIWSACVHLILFQVKPTNEQQAITCLSLLTVINILIPTDNMITVNKKFVHKLARCDPNCELKLHALAKAHMKNTNTHTHTQLL